MLFLKMFPIRTTNGQNEKRKKDCMMKYFAIPITNTTQFRLVGLKIFMPNARQKNKPIRHIFPFRL